MSIKSLDDVRVQLQYLIDKINEKTGNDDTNLTNAINTLLNKYADSIKTEM